jgi:hypothetical protein
LIKRLVTDLRAGDAAAVTDERDRLVALGQALSVIANDTFTLHFMQSVARAEATGAIADFVDAHDQYFGAMVLVSAQQFTEALPLLRRARSALLGVASPLQGRAELEIAAAQYYSARYAEAGRALTKLIARFEQRKHASLLTRAVWLRGMTQFALRDLAGARGDYEAMLDTAEKTGDLDYWVMAKTLLASLHDTLGDRQLAWRHRVDAAFRLHDVVNEFTRTLYLFGSAADSAAAQRYSAAVLFQSLLLDASTSIPPGTDAQLRSQRAASLHLLRRGVEARTELAVAHARLSEVANVPVRLRVEADVLAAEADVLLETDLPRARAAVERLITLPIVKADALRRARAHLQLTDLLMQLGEDAEAERSVQKGLVALDGFRHSVKEAFALRATDRVWDLYARAAELATKRGDLSSALAFLERGRARTAREQNLWGDAPLTLRSVQNRLPARTAILMMSRLRDRLHVWVLRRERIASHSVPMESARGAALVAEHLREMIRGDTSPAASRQLFAEILRPVAAAFDDAQQIVVIADAPYHRIAFAGLRDSRRDRYFVEDHEVVLSPSVTAFARGLDAPNRSPRLDSRRDVQPSCRRRALLMLTSRQAR